jgi:type IV pilus assembly protein PilY1
LTMSVHAASTDLSTLPLSTYYAPSSVDVKPNILFVLDDSGSMDWDAMPDQAAWYINYNSSYLPGNYNSNVDNGMPPYMRYNSAFNGVAYNPAVRYLPPVKYNADGSLNTTTYPSMTGTSAATGGVGWVAVKNDGFGVQSTGTSDLSTGVYAFVTIPGEFCDKPNLRTCTTQTTPSTANPYPATMRWCTTASLTNCSATWDSSRMYPRMPAPRIATIAVSGSSSTSVSGITVGGLQIMSAGASASTSSATVASRITDAINACSNAKPSGSACTTVGYTATVNGSTVTIYAPGATTATPSVSKAGTMTLTTTAFAQSNIPLPYWRDTSVTPNQSSTTIPGENLRHTITPFVTSYPYPGSASKAPGRTDCALSTCTYAEEMTNYANWYAYYHTRMQLIKTAASQAFAGIDKAADIAANTSRFRVGLMTINNNTGTDFVNLDEFKTAHKNEWYNKLFAAIPNDSTPLRTALSTAGRLYAGNLNSSTLNGVSVTDPLQYSCQQNFTILSTDGFWNSGAGYMLDGSTLVGDQDGAWPAPYNDGGTAVTQQRTSWLQSSTETQRAEKGTLQTRTSQQQTRTSQLQKQTYSQLQTRTSNNSGTTWTAWTDVASGNCTWKTSGGTTRTQCRYNGAAWSAWANETTSCTPQAIGISGANGTVWSPGVQCQYLPWTAWAGIGGTCNAVAQDTTGTWSVPVARQCQTVSSGYANAASCAVTAPDASGNYTECQYNWAAAAATPTITPAYVANDYTNATVYRNPTYPNSGWTNAATCTEGTTWSATGTRTTCQYANWSGWGNVASCTPVAQSAGPNYTVGTAVECQNVASGSYVSDTLADVAAYYYKTDLRNSAATGTDVTGTCTGPIIAPSTTANDLCNNNVAKTSVRDVAAWQHMTTFTLGLGAQGKMLFQPDYQNDNYWKATSGDFYSVAQGVTADPANGICSWLAAGSRCVWPTPSSDNPANIDDLWHAAVNGRGSYFSATDPASLANGLASTLAAIVDAPRPGTSAAAASSNPNISAGDNYVFSSYYKSVDWYGDLYRQRFDIATQDLSSAVDWSAKALLDCAMTPWASGKAYVAGDVYRNGTTCYLVTTDYVAGGTFATIDTNNSAIVTYSPASCTAWAPNTSYAVGSIFSQGTPATCYYVIKAYTSGATFGTSDTANTNAAYVAGAPTACSTAWAASTTYASGSTYTRNNVCYDVTSAYTSGGTFGASDTANTISPYVPRNIYTKGSSGLANFAWTGTNSLTATQKAYFTGLTYAAGPPATGLSQFCTPFGIAPCLSSTAQTNTTVATGGAAGEALVNFLRGDRTNEGTFFRTRKHVLGDIVSSEARYIKTPLFDYTDAGYSAYKTSSLITSRASAVYVASNDGMLHAFNAETGKELWAYVPEIVLPQIYKLADPNYGQNHQYFVDGTPEVGDVCPSAPTTPCTGAQWKNILVGGLNRGGKGYYALDITDPANPALLWEFTNANMGYSYGNPRITKLKTGQWVVLLTSGYNNADGVGHLFVLDAYSGALIRTIDTSAGTPGTPSGLARISAYSTTADTNNMTSAVYGGDMLGNLWRFDINGDIGAAGYDAQLLVTFVDGSGSRQPITAKPVVTTVDGKPVVYVGTGSYLGVSDVGSTQSQTMYAVKDKLDATTYSNPRANGSGFVAQTLVAATCTNEGSCTPGESIRKITSPSDVNWSTNNGWYVDFLTPGERANTDPALALGTLAFTTNTPNNASVEPCGEPGADTSAAWFYALDYKSGGPVYTSGGVVARSLGNVIATRPVLIRLPDGTVMALIRTSGGSSGGSSGGGSGTAGYFPGAKEDGKTAVLKPPVNPSGGSSRRVSWREITN